MPVNDGIEIIQLAIDGEATPEQETRLRQMLANSPEARATHDALRNLAQQLDSVPLVDPPPMREDILANLPANVAPFHSRRRILLGLAYAAAAVIVIGVAVQRFVPPPHSATATMARL